MTTRAMLVSLAMAVVVVGCGKKSSGNGSVTRACDTPNVAICTTYTAPPATLDSNNLTQAACEAIAPPNGPGTFGQGCSATNRVGRCNLSGSGISVTYSYYSSGWDSTTAQADCAAPPAGTWVPG
jgi:hypothetical protein